MSQEKDTFYESQKEKLPYHDNVYKHFFNDYLLANFIANNQVKDIFITNSYKINNLSGGGTNTTTHSKTRSRRSSHNLLSKSYKNSSSAQLSPQQQTPPELSIVAQKTTTSQGSITSGIPKQINEHIKQNMRYEVKIENILFDYDFEKHTTKMDNSTTHTVSLFMYFENHKPSSTKLKKATTKILGWLNMLYMFKQLNEHLHSRQKQHGSLVGCEAPKHLNCYFYFTSLKKQLPAMASTDAYTAVLSEINANTGFTHTCAYPSNNIVIYRKEEWFKVFIHETIHAFGLDFSNAPQATLDHIHKQVLELFPTIGPEDSKVNLYEAYTEMWAEIIQLMIDCMHESMHHYEAIYETINEENVHYIYNLFEHLLLPRLILNRNFGIVQMFKILHFMKIEHFKQLFMAGGYKSRIQFKESTSILAYYIIKNIMMCNMSGFFDFCEHTMKHPVDYSRSYDRIDILLKPIHRITSLWQQGQKYVGEKMEKQVGPQVEQYKAQAATLWQHGKKHVGENLEKQHKNVGNYVEQYKNQAATLWQHGKKHVGNYFTKKPADAAPAPAPSLPPSITIKDNTHHSKSKTRRVDMEGGIKAQSHYERAVPLVEGVDYTTAKNTSAFIKLVYFYPEKQNLEAFVKYIAQSIQLMRRPNPGVDYYNILKIYDKMTMRGHHQPASSKSSSSSERNKGPKKIHGYPYNSLRMSYYEDNIF